MLVSMSNAVKIESVPLNFDKFLAVHPRRPSLSTGSDYRAGGALTSMIAELPSFDPRWSSVLRSFVRRGVGTAVIKELAVRSLADQRSDLGQHLAPVAVVAHQSPR
jgi:hypothetical protein